MYTDIESRRMCIQTHYPNVCVHSHTTLPRRFGTLTYLQEVCVHSHTNQKYEYVYSDMLYPEAGVHKQTTQEPVCMNILPKNMCTQTFYTKV